MSLEKIALVFPGQGSQYPGMGKEFYNQFPFIKEFFDQADKIIGFELTKKIFEGTESELKQTEITQPAVFAVGLVCEKVLFNQVPKLKSYCSYVCGHSLGEYTAITSAQIVDFATGLRMVQKRGEFIKIASTNNPGTMAAILGLENSKIREICNQFSDKGIVEPVNFNSPGQVVIAGNVAAVEFVCQLAQSAGAVKTIILNVSGPFHSRLMKEAGILLEKELDNYQFNDAIIPVVTNCDAQPTIKGSEIKQKLVKQVAQPVLWEESVKNIISLGTRIFIELGPGKVLSGLIKKIDRSVKILNVEDIKSLEKTVTELNIIFGG